MDDFELIVSNLDDFMIELMLAYNYRKLGDEKKFKRHFYIANKIKDIRIDKTKKLEI